MRSARIAAVIMMLSGCQMVGPDYVRPSNSLPEQWELSSDTAELPIEWWKSFNDKVFDDIIERSIKNNLDLQLASSRVEQSRALLGVTEASELPSLDFATDYQNKRASEKGLMDPSGKKGLSNYDVTSVGVGLSWEIDMWGRLRRATEAQRASFIASEYNRRAVQVSLMADVATYYFQLRSIQQELDISKKRQLFISDRQTLLKERYSYGVGSQDEIESNQIELDQTEVLLSELSEKEKLMKNAISFLVGEKPGALTLSLPENYQLPQIDNKISLGLPSELALRRPDIREAEEKLHQATANIGVAKADYYPRITLTGNAGYQALSLSDLGSWSSHTFGIGPTLYLPIFDGGKIKQQVQFNEYKQKEAGINYQSVVLKAWHEVDNAISNYKTQQKKLSILRSSLDSSNKNLSLSLNRFSTGSNNNIDIINSKVDTLSTKLLVVSSQRDTIISSIELYRSLGGGWENTFPVINN